MKSAGDWAKALLAHRPSSDAKLMLRIRVAIRLMVAPSSLAKFKRELTPPPLNQNYLHRLLRFLSGLAAHIWFWLFVDGRCGGFPTFATCFRGLRSIVGEVSRVRVS
jgi:hypothetical protein